MTATEKYKRAEALFNDRTKRELADMVVHREADLEDARAENEELWALNEHMGLKYMAAMGELGQESDQLKDENDKLRKLVSDMWHELNYTSVRAENGTNHCLDHMAAFDARMEDLEIEVDE